MTKGNGFLFTINRVNTTQAQQAELANTSASADSGYLSLLVDSQLQHVSGAGCQHQTVSEDPYAGNYMMQAH